MISCPAAKQMRCVKPSITTVSPSWTCAATASRMVVTLEGALKRSGSSDIAQALVDHGEGRIDVLGSDDQRRREPKRALPRPQQQEAALERPLPQLLHDLRRRLSR